MTTEPNETGTRQDARWVKAESGALYLCPSAILEFLDEFTEEELKDLCVRRSEDQYVN